MLNFPKPNPLHKKFNQGKAANWKHFGSWATWNSGGPCQAWLPWHDCVCLTRNLVYKSTAITYCNIQYRSHGTEPHERFKCEASTNSCNALAISKTGFESRDVAFQSRDVTFQTWVSSCFNSISRCRLRSLKTNEQLVKSRIVNKQLICSLAYTHWSKFANSVKVWISIINWCIIIMCNLPW